MDDDEALEELRSLYARKGQLDSDQEGRTWLEQVSGLLHRLAPARASEFDNLTPNLLTSFSPQIMRPLWYRIGLIVQAAIVEAERGAKVSGPSVEAGSPARENEQASVSVTEGQADTQKKLLQFVYDHMVRTGEWPPTRLVRIEMRREGPLEDLCREVGTDLIVCNLGGGSHDTCALRLNALQYVEGAERDVENVLRGMTHLVDRYIHAEGEPSASYREFMTALGMTEREAHRVAAFLRYAGIWAHYSSSDTDPSGHGVLSHGILEFENVNSLEDLLSRLRSWRDIPPGPSAHTSDVVPRQSWIERLEMILRREKETRGVLWTVLGAVMALVIAAMALL